MCFGGYQRNSNEASRIGSLLNRFCYRHEDTRGYKGILEVTVFSVITQMCATFCKYSEKYTLGYFQIHVIFFIKFG